MSAETKDGMRARNGTPSVRTRIVPEFTAAFWSYWLLAATAGEIAGHALNHIYLHRSGRVIVVLMLCFVAMSILQGASRRFPRMIFWFAAFLLSLLGAVLARTTDISMGGGDIGAILLIAILLIFSFVICYRLTGNLPGPMDGSNVRGFFWTTALLAQTAANACADWILDTGVPSEHMAIGLITLGIAATVGLYSCTRMPRSVLFWPAFLLWGTAAALAGHVAIKSIECSTQNAAANCRLSAIFPPSSLKTADRFIELCGDRQHVRQG
ncbi:hypothetical protein [Bradyrhizobium sp. Bra64]|uniref:hypothetical protein n=1 Tax=Bradyrhizobium sp. Bra64 TaxID=2926009 RepID=UPI002117301A|nr:hypothetical protein [Bradyrhizobium sp. Bra64]